MSISQVRVHRRGDAIRESLQQGQEQQGDGQQGDGQQEEMKDDGVFIGLNLFANWLEFWKQAKIYPEPTVEYPDTSAYVSSRQRQRCGAMNRMRANAYVSDTDSDLDSGDEEQEQEATTCTGCRDKQANQVAHMDYGGCLYVGVVN
jgi:hypothetical protein